MSVLLLTIFVTASWHITLGLPKLSAEQPSVQFFFSFFIAFSEALIASYNDSLKLLFKAFSVNDCGR